MKNTTDQGGGADTWPAANGTGGQAGEQPAAVRPEMINEILGFNDESEVQEGQWSRAWLAAEQVRQAAAAARHAGINWANADLNHKALQAEHPERTAPRPRQWLIAAIFLGFDAVACYFAAEALNGSPAVTLAWAGLFLALLGAGEVMLDLSSDDHPILWRWTVGILATFIALLGTLRFWFLAATTANGGVLAAIIGASLFTLATASFIVIGYRALRIAETGHAWKSRRRVRACAKALNHARREVERLRARRDRIARAYLSRIRVRLIRICTAEQLPDMERAVLAHLIGEDPASEERP